MTNDNAPALGGQGRQADNAPELKGQRPLHCGRMMERHPCHVNDESFLVWVCIYCGTMDFDWDESPVSKLPPGRYEMALQQHGRVIAFTTLEVKEP